MQDRKMVNALDAYLTVRHIKSVEFARQVSASESTISRLRRGLQVPSYPLVRRIHAATKGEVSADDFMIEAAE